MDVGKVLSETAERIPHKAAVIFKDEEITFAQLDRMATCLANKLKTFSVSRGDPVAIVLPNSSQHQGMIAVFPTDEQISG